MTRRIRIRFPGQTLQALAGTVALAGQGASLSLSRRLAGAVGGVPISGQSANLTWAGGGGGAFSLPQVSGALTWNRVAVTNTYPQSIQSSYPYAGTKHTRWARRSVDGMWYVLGGDFSHLYPDGVTTDAPDGWTSDAANDFWKVDPSTRPFTWTRLNGPLPPAGHKIPAHVDEAAFMYDSKRDRFLLYPYPRWPYADTADVIVGHLMTFDPNTNTWTDLGTGTYTGPTGTYDPTNNPQFDPTGKQYPINYAYGRWGIYDEATDKFYIPWPNSGLLVLNASDYSASDYSIAEWPIKTYGDTGGSPYPLYNGVFHSSCICFDRLRRRFVALRTGYDYPTQAQDPNHMKLWCLPIDPDPVSGVRTPFYIPQDQLEDPANGLWPDFEATLHDEVNDLYIVYGGAKLTNNDILQTNPTNDWRAIPATGGNWKQYLPTDTRPEARWGQTMHTDPRYGTFELGGISDNPSTPEMFFPVVNASAIGTRPAWRQAMPANTWVALASSATIASFNPENDSSINPNYPNPSPWIGLVGQSAMMKAWNGAAYDDLNHVLHIDAAGGHGDYAGNESYRIDLSVASPAWTPARKPTGAIGNTGVLDDGLESTGVYFDGRPRSNHTYGAPVFVPNVGNIQPCIVGSYRAGASSVAKVVKFDPVTGATSVLLDFSGVTGLAVGPAFTPVPASCYDPTRRCIWTFYTGTSKIQKYNIVSNTVEAVGPSQTWAGWMIGCVYLPEVDAILLIGRPGTSAADTAPSTGLSIVNLRTFTQTKLNYTGSFAPGFSLVQTTDSLGFISGFQWDVVRHRLVLWQNSTNTAQISTLTPGANYFTDSWTAGALTVSGSNTVTPSAAQPNGTYGRFAYSPSYDGVFLINNVTDPVYFYAFS